MAIEYLNTNLNAEDDFCNSDCSCASPECEGEAPVPNKMVGIFVHGETDPIVISGSDAVNALYDFSHGHSIRYNGRIIPFESITYLMEREMPKVYQITNVYEDVAIPTESPSGEDVTATFNGVAPAKIIIYQSGTTTVIAQNDDYIASGGTLTFTMPAMDVTVGLESQK